MNIRIDTLDYSNDLQKAGIERAHAEAIARLQARALHELVEHELVTKDYLKSELGQLRSDLRSEMGQLEARLCEEIRGESTSLREEIRNQSTGLREEIRNESAARRRDMDALMLQIRSLQLGGAIAAFAPTAVVLLSRLIR